MGSDSAGTATAAPQKSFGKRLAVLLFKVIVAVAGIWFVARMVHWDDSATVAAGKTIRNLTFDHDTDVVILSKQEMRAVGTRPGAAAASQPAEIYLVKFPRTVEVTTEGETGKTLHLTINDANREHYNLPRELLLPASLFKADHGEAVHDGLRSLLGVARKRWYFLVAAWGILVIPFLVTAVRWRNLMRPQGIEMPLSKCLQLTFVGQFYSIILPGITGGDLVKIVYAARLTGSKTKSLITILLDRVIGLVALMTIGGASAAWQLWENQKLAASGVAVTGDATLRNVLLLICGVLGGMAVFCIVYFSHRLRAATGMKYVLEHSRMPDFVRRADEVLHTYRGHFGLLLWAFLISLLSQLTLPVSAWLSGMAFGVHMHVAYYLAYVPVAILAVSLPTLPQGAGVLDAVIVHFFANRGMATASQAFAIAQAIRFLPILWNLVGGYWVVTGTYSRHAAQEESARIRE
ncbi:MAG: lysylphosphatidylglycerol synthase transmembrane domain-containing protein [Phycisphaerae bacterium]